MLTAELPHVDLSESDYLSSLRRGLCETGFFYLRDSAAGAKRLQDLRAETASFMSGSVEEKARMSQFLRGYAALGSEHTEAGFGTGEYGEGDLCEKYTIGVTPDPEDRRKAPEYYSAPEAQRFFGQNIFPNSDFRQAWLIYFESLSRTAETLLGAVRQALNLPESEWSEETSRPVSILRFLNYPETSSNSLRMAAHYDDNLLTLLHQSVPENGFDSLQVMLPNETHWRSVPAQDDFFVVNVGEALMYLTEGRVVATKHRVASVPEHLREGSARTSAAFFCTPNWDCGLRPVSPQGVDHELGQMAKDFGLNELRDPDGSIPYYRLQNRAVDRGFVS